MKKYKIRKDLKLDLGFAILYRIEKLSNGELGGYIEKEDNLSHIGHAWIYENARVSGNARVYGNAQVCDDAWVSGNARVYGDAKVFGDAQVYGNAEVYGNAQVYGNARIYGDAQVYGDADVYGNARVSKLNHIVNFILAFKFSITITPDNIVIGCQIKKRKEWLKITEKEACKMGLTKDLYPQYIELVKAGMKLVPSRDKINKESINN